MNCAARKDYSGGDGGGYSVDASGVRANGTLYAWADPGLAAQFLAGAKAHAVTKCNHALANQALEAKRTTPNTPLPETVNERAVCKPMLERICSSAHGAAALLDNGKDVSVLCGH